MYKIILKNGGFICSEILESAKIKNARLGLTNLQIEIENNKNKPNVFIQDSKPNLSTEFWKVEGGVIVDMNENEIESREAEKINNSFFSKNIKLHVPNLDNVLKADFGNYWIKFNSNKNIIVKELQQIIDENGITIMPYNIFLNIISSEDQTNFDSAILAGLITKEVNTTKTLEI